MTTSLKLRVCTWNVGNAPPPRDLTQWLGCNEDDYDIIVVAAQEASYKEHPNSPKSPSHRPEKPSADSTRQTDRAGISDHSDKTPGWKRVLIPKKKKISKATKLRHNSDQKSVQRLSSHAKPVNGCLGIKFAREKGGKLGSQKRGRNKRKGVSIYRLGGSSFSSSDEHSTICPNDVPEDCEQSSSSTPLTGENSASQSFTSTTSNNASATTEASSKRDNGTLAQTSTGFLPHHEQKNLEESSKILSSDRRNRPKQRSNVDTHDYKSSVAYSLPATSNLHASKEDLISTSNEDGAKQTCKIDNIDVSDTSALRAKQDTHPRDGMGSRKRLSVMGAETNFNVLEKSTTVQHQTKKPQKDPLQPRNCRNKAAHRVTTHKFSKTVRLCIGKQYILIAKQHLMEIKLLVFVHSRHLFRIGKTESVTEATGIGNMVGNKGAVALKFRIDDICLCFVSSHLAAHEGVKFLQSRNDDVIEIMRNLERAGRVSSVPSIHQFSHIIWMGDLNYRLDLERAMPQATTWKHCTKWEYIRGLVENNDFKTLALYDELQGEIKKQTVFANFKEGPINFKPTFKVERDNECFEYQRLRLPSYCDRVLWHSLPMHEENIRLLRYSSIESYWTSDHKPVYASFQLNIPRKLRRFGKLVPSNSFKCTIDFHYIALESLLKKNRSWDDLMDEYEVLEDGVLMLLDENKRDASKNCAPCIHGSDKPCLASHKSNDDELGDQNAPRCESDRPDNADAGKFGDTQSLPAEPCLHCKSKGISTDNREEEQGIHENECIGNEFDQAKHNDRKSLLPRNTGAPTPSLSTTPSASPFQTNPSAVPWTPPHVKPGAKCAKTYSAIHSPLFVSSPVSPPPVYMLTSSERSDDDTGKRNSIVSNRDDGNVRDHGRAVRIEFHGNGSFLKNKVFRADGTGARHRNGGSISNVNGTSNAGGANGGFGIPLADSVMREWDYGELPKIPLCAIVNLNDLRYQYATLVFGRAGSRSRSSCVLPLAQLAQSKSADARHELHTILDVTRYGRVVARAHVRAELCISMQCWIDSRNKIVKKR